MAENEQITTEEETQLPDVTPDEPAEEEDALVVAARGWLRIGTSSRDEEIRQVIDACLIDLKIGGVAVRDPDDKLIQQAIKLYLKSQFGYDNNAEKFGEAYEHLRNALSLSEDYNTESEDDDGETG